MNSMVFYKSFYDAIKLLPPDLRLKAYDTVLAYGIDGDEPLDDLDAYVEMVFTLIRPQIDANNKRRSSGQTGGRPSHTVGKNEETNGFEDEKPVVIENENQWFSETETDGYENGKPNVNVNVNDNVNDNDNENVKGGTGGKTQRFSPPTVTDVQNYADSKGYKLDAERFIDYYASKGWTVGKSPMKDWRAAVRNWAKNDRASPTKNKFNNFEAREGNASKYAELERVSQGQYTPPEDYAALEAALLGRR